MAGLGRGLGRGRGSIKEQRKTESDSLFSDSSEEDNGSFPAPHSSTLPKKSKSDKNCSLDEDDGGEDGRNVETAQTERAANHSSVHSSSTNESSIETGSDDATKSEAQTGKEEDDSIFEIENSEVVKVYDKDKELLENGYLLPSTVLYLPTKGSGIVEGAVIECVMGQVVSLSEFYLAIDEFLPEEMNQFIAEMSAHYKKAKLGPLGHKLRLRERETDLLKDGGFIACRNRTGTALSDEEIVRAKIIEQVPPPARIKRPKETDKFYKVFFVDLGQYMTVEESDMFILHEDFAEMRPALSIPCRAALSQRYNKYHTLETTWDPLTTAKFAQVTMTEYNDKGEIERRPVLTVEFRRKILEEGMGGQPGNMKCWEVSIMELSKPRHRFIQVRLEQSTHFRPIEIMVIKHTMRKYKRDKDVPDQEDETKQRLARVIENIENNRQHELRKAKHFKKRLLQQKQVEQKEQVPLVALDVPKIEDSQEWGLEGRE